MAISDLPRGKKIVLGLVGVIALAGGGVALAAWLAGGTGTGAAEATDAIPLDVESGTTAEQLYPGGSGDVIARITNDNRYPVSVTDVSSSGTIDSNATAACDGSTGVSYVDSETTDDLPLTIGPQSTETLTLDDAVSMSNASHNDCQGAVFTIPLSATGESAAE